MTMTSSIEIYNNTIMKSLILLQHKRLNRKAKLRDDQGQEMLAIDVFAASINYLRNELLRHIQNAVKDFGPKDVYWVITVPAIWDDSAKQFMREAANMVIFLF